MNYQKIRIDFTQKRSSTAPVVFKTGEIDVDGIEAELVNIDVEGTPSGYVSIHDPEGKKTEGIVTFTNGLARFDIPKKIEGVHTFELTVLNKGNKTRSGNLEIEVIRSLNDNTTDYEDLLANVIKNDAAYTTNENVRKSNEVIRIENDLQRKQDFENLTAGKQLDSEVIIARNGKATLKDNIESKRDKSVLLNQSDLSTSSEAHKITPNHLNQAVKNLMTGSAPVSPNIADGSITTEKIADGAISLIKMKSDIFDKFVAFELSATTTNVNKTKYSSIVLDKTTLKQNGQFTCKLFTKETLESFDIALFTSPNGNPSSIGTRVPITPKIKNTGDGVFEVSCTYSISSSAFETQNFNFLITSYYGFEKQINFVVDKIIFNERHVDSELVINYGMFHGSNPLLPNDKMKLAPSRYTQTTEYDLEKLRLTLVPKITIPKIAFLGDSITFGVGVSSSSGRFSTLVSKHFASVEQNLGVSSTRFTEQVLGDNCFANRVETISPDSELIVVFGGTNDYWHNMPLGFFDNADIQSFYGAVNRVLGTIRQTCRNSEVVLVIPYRQFFNGKGSETPNAKGHKLSDYVDALISLANYYSVPVLNLFSENSFDVEHQPHQRELFVPDGVHPNDYGSERIAKRVIRKIESIF